MSNGLTYTAAKLVGAPSPSSWAQVFLSDKDQDNPQLFFTLSVLNETDVETAAVGKELAENFLQTFFEQKGKPWENLKLSLEKLTNIAKEKSITVDISCGVLWHGCLYGGTIGESKLLFRRGNNLVELLSGKKETIETISGFVAEEDLLILCSAGFTKLVELQTVLVNLDHKPLSEVVEALSPIVLGSPDNSLAAAFFVQFTRTIEAAEKEEISIEAVSKPIKENLKAKAPLPILGAVKTFLAKIFLPLLTKITVPSWSKTLPQEGKLSFYQSRSKKTILTVAILLLALLLTSVVLGIRKKQSEKEHQIFSKTYEESKAKTEEGKAIIDLNPTLARNLLFNSKQEVEATKKELKNKNSSDYKTLLALDKQIDELLSSISRVYKISQPDLFYDLTLVKDKAVGSRFSLYKTNLAILDSTNNSVYSLQTDNKSIDVVGGGQGLGQPLFVGTQTDKIHIFSSTVGVVEINVKSKVTKTVVKSDKDWGEIISLVDFAGNIYLLDAKKGQVIKYMVTEEGFSSAKNYLRPDVAPDFSQAMAMTIDGSVWVLNKNGSITKFTQGRPDNFNISGLDINFSSPKTIFTYDQAKNIYVLDSGNNRVVVLAKTGDYVAQYQWSGMGQVTDLVVNEDLGKILLLAGNKIYSINLK